MVSRGHVEASLVQNSEAMYSDLVQELLAKVGDAHATAMRGLKATYEAQLQGLKREHEGSNKISLASSFSACSGIEDTSATAVANLSVEKEGTIGVEGEIDIPRSTTTTGCMHYDIEGGSCAINENDAVKRNPSGKSCDSLSFSELSLSRLSLESGTSPGGRCEKEGNGRGSMNRNLTLRKQWSVHPEQDETHLIAFAEASNQNLAGLRKTLSRDSVLEGGRSCQDLVAKPGASWKLGWDLCGAVLIGYDTVMIPFALSFEPEDNFFFALINWGTMIFWTFDMIFTFFVGYLSKSGHTVMKLQLIAKRYLRTWFVLDLVVVLGDWFANVGKALNSGQEGDVSNTASLVRALRAIRVLRLLRLLKLKGLTAGLQDHISSENVYLALGVVKLLFFILLLNHIVACAWFALGSAKLRDNDANWISANKCEHRALSYKYATSLHWSLTQFTPASMEVFPQNTAERTMCVFVLMFALGVFSSFLGSISTSMTALRNMNADVSKQFWMLRRFLKQHKVSKLVVRRILRYLEYRLEKKQGRVQQASVTILALLSEQLREELTFELTSPQIHDQSFFDYFLAFPLMDVVVRKICTAALKTNIFASGDHLFYQGDEATFVYCFLRGQMDYFLEDSSPIDPPVMEHEWIGEVALWVPWKYVGTFAAQAESELLAIDIGQFIKHISQNLLSWKYASRYGEILVGHLLKGSAQNSDIIRDNDLMGSLTEGLAQEHMAQGLHSRLKRRTRISSL